MVNKNSVHFELRYCTHYVYTQTPPFVFLADEYIIKSIDSNDRSHSAYCARLFEPCNEKTSFCGNDTSDKRLCFRYTDFLNPEFQVSNHILCCTVCLVSDLVGNPKGRLSRDAAHLFDTQLDKNK